MNVPLFLEQLAIARMRKEGANDAVIAGFAFQRMLAAHPRTAQSYYASVAARKAALTK